MKKPDSGSPDAADATIGMRIRVLRVGQRMSRENLADALGLGCQQIQQYETGISRVSASRLEAIAVALNVDLSEFYHPEPKAAKSGFAKPDDIALRLLKAFNRIESTETREKMVTLVERIADIHK